MLKILNFLAIALMFTACCDASAKKEIASAGVVQPIVLDQPARPAGQEDVIALTAPKMDTVRVGFIGLGMRGPGAVKRFYLFGGSEDCGFVRHTSGESGSCSANFKESGFTGSCRLFGYGRGLETIV